MAARLPVLALLLAIAGCSCEQVFSEGAIVEHRLLGERYVVIQSASVQNYQGMCLVTLRDEGGSLLSVDVAELRPTPGEGDG